MSTDTLEATRGLIGDNPWWNSKEGFKIERLPLFKRSDFFFLQKKLEENKVFVMTGTRRIGKSTIMMQLIENLLIEKKVKPSNILYVSLDRPYIELYENKLMSIIQFFEESIHKSTLGKGEKVYLFIDEAQYDPTWTRIFKQFVEQNRNFFAIVSGSSATAIYKNTIESGAGRFERYSLFPIKFRDIVIFRNENDEKKILTASLALRKALTQAIVSNNAQLFVDEYKRNLSLFAELKAGIIPIFEEYLLKGGYPQFYSEESWEEVSRFYQTNVFDSIIQKDIVNVYKIKSPSKVRKLLVQILDLTGNRISRSKLAGTIKSTEKTVDQFVDALSEGFLIRTTSKYTSNLRGSTKEKKFFATDVGLRNAFLNVKDIRSIDEREYGGILETVCLDHSLRLSYSFDKASDKEAYYWLDEESERDIVLKIDFGKKKIPLPIEVKKGLCGEGDLKKMRITMSKINANFGIICCRDEVRADKNLLILPTWLFLLSC